MDTKILVILFLGYFYTEFLLWFLPKINTQLSKNTISTSFIEDFTNIKVMFNYLIIIFSCINVIYFLLNKLWLTTAISALYLTFAILCSISTWQIAKNEGKVRISWTIAKVICFIGIVLMIVFEFLHTI